MIPVKLSLQGFLSYKNPVSVDLSQIKVACVSGSNGAGKSTLFDAMTWSLFGRARRNDDGVIHTSAESCQVVFEFDYEGIRYRVDRIKPRGKSTTLEFHAQTPDGTWKAFTESGMRATEERIQDILGLDYDTFVNASFFLQGKADLFSMQTPGKRKEILSNILGLTVWETYRDTAALRKREVQKHLDVQQSIMREVVMELDEESSRKERLASAQEMLDMKAKVRESKEKLLELAQQETAQIKNDKEKMDMLVAQAAQVERDLADTVKKLRSRTNEMREYREILEQQDQIIASHDNYQKVREELTKLNKISTQHNELVLRKTKMEGELQSEKVRLEQDAKNLRLREAEVAVLKRHLKQLEQDAAEKKSEAEHLQAQIQELEALETDQDKKKDLQSEKEGENKQLRVKMDEVKERITYLQKSDGPDCPLCGQPLNADHKTKIVAQLKSEGTSLGDRFRGNKETIAECKQNIKEISSKVARIRSLRPRLTDVLADAGTLSQRLEESESKIEKWGQEGAKRLAEITEQLEEGQYLKQIQPQLDAVAQKIDGLGYDSKGHDKLRDQEQKLRVFEEKFRKLEQARTAQAGLEREVSELGAQKTRMDENHQQLQRTINTLSQQIKNKREKTADPAQLEKELRDAREDENHARQAVGIAQQNVNVLENLRKRKKELESNSRELSRQIARLKMLETAFGKDGVPALLIENAIPHIETQANEILDKLSGGNMSVSFETERDYADKKRQDRKQTLDIIIRDSAGSRAYELFSGGEAFRINFAIRLALSRVLAQRSGARLQTLVIDEGFGSQDAEGRQRLVEAINLVKDDFEKILVITHLDELKDAFSSRIEVTKNQQGSQVEVII